MPSTYTPIATTTLTGSQSSVTFSSISGTYTDLVLVVSAAVNADALWVQYNGDTAANYSIRVGRSQDGSVSSNRIARNSGGPNDRRLELGAAFLNTVASTILHIMDYSNTTHNKMTLARTGQADKRVELGIGCYYSTSAITQIVVNNSNAANWTAGGTMSLYGIKAA